jgi:hypothetical protein
MYKDHNGECIVVLEAVADYGLWIWHTYFGMAGSHNNINMLQQSLVLGRLTEGHAPAVNYVVNGREYTKGYYLADSIYPKWATFVKTIPTLILMQELGFRSAKRLAGKMLSRHLVCFKPILLVQSTSQMWEVMNACVIMHNMIIESERDVLGENTPVRHA